MRALASVFFVLRVFRSLLLSCWHGELDQLKHQQLEQAAAQHAAWQGSSGRSRWFGSLELS